MIYYSDRYYITVHTTKYNGKTLEFEDHKKAQAFYDAMLPLVEAKVIKKVRALTGREMIAREIDSSLMNGSY